MLATWVKTLYKGYLISKGVFKGHMSTGSKVFYRLTCVDDTIFVLPGVFIFKEAICPRNLAKALSNDWKKSTSGWRAWLKTRFSFSVLMCVWQTNCTKACKSRTSNFFSQSWEGATHLSSVGRILNNYSSRPHGLWVKSPWGRRPNELLTQRPWGREE